jgi:hypothetical protein
MAFDTLGESSTGEHLILPRRRAPRLARERLIERTLGYTASARGPDLPEGGTARSCRRVCERGGLRTQLTSEHL